MFRRARSGIRSRISIGEKENDEQKEEQEERKDIFLRERKL